MKKLLLIITLLPAVTGCNAQLVRDFQNSEYAGVESSGTSLFVAESGEKLVNSSEILSVLGGSSERLVELNKNIKAYCPRPTEKVEPAAIPVLAAAGKTIYNYFLDKSLERVEKLEKAATQTYSSRVFLTSEMLSSLGCAVFVRYSDDEKTRKRALTAYLIMQLDDVYGTAFSMTPKSGRFYDAVAVSKKTNIVQGDSSELFPVSQSQAGKPDIPLINASVAIAVKTIGITKEGVPNMFNVGDGVVTISNIEVGPHGKAFSEEYDSSDLIPYPEQRNKAVSLTVSITEVGHTGIKFDKAKAELTAIKEAIGPAISSAIETGLKEQ